MAKKQEGNKSKKTNDISLAANPAFAGLPVDQQERLKAIQEKLDTFAKKVVEKFDKYVVGISMLPPRAQAPGVTQQQQQPIIDPETGKEKEVNPNQIDVLILIDDSDSKKMTKQELKDKLGKIIQEMGTEIDKNIVTETIIITELWQMLYDGKTELLQELSMGTIIYDTGTMAAIKISEIHKTMVLKKFEKYIVSYVLAGSIVRGQATKTSDIDVFIVIDDTDVKKMTRAELKDKLRAIILGMGFEAGQMTGIKNKINIQVYILTDFWDSLKEANPVIFTLLRDGVPFYDRGIFMPWKQLLKMGKIKPSDEAIDMFMSSGEQMLKRVELKMKEIGMEDIYYAILTPSQAALMMYGIPPPAPRETAELLKDVFVKKEKLLEEKWINILANVIKVRKDLEHGTKKEMKGAEIDKMLKDADEFLKRLKTLFEAIEKRKEEGDVLHIYESIVTVIRDALKVEGVTDKIKDENIIKYFEDHLIAEGKMPQKYKRMLEEIIKAKKDFDAKKLTKNEVEKTKKDSREIMKFVIEYIQRKKGRELERAKIRVKHGEKYGEVIMLDKIAFIIHDIDNQDSGISKGTITDEGGVIDITSSNLEELEQELTKIEIPNKVYLKERVFEDMKTIFGKDVEILMNY